MVAVQVHEIDDSDDDEVERDGGSDNVDSDSGDEGSPQEPKVKLQPQTTTRGSSASPIVLSSAESSAS